MGNLTPELARMRDETRELAANYGLDFYDVIFELVDYDELNMIAAYGGFPTRYPHWRFGMEYEQLSKSYQYGLSKIYELVINNDPCYAYLMRSNSLTDQKLVMAHVYGHCDFFKNNLWFSKTSRKMMDIMANHGAKIRRFMDRYGVEVVENFIDRVNSLDNLIDVYSPFIARDDGTAKAKAQPKGVRGPDAGVHKMEASEYMDRYINPPEFIERQREEAKADHMKDQRFPARPQRDLLKFLLEYAPLEAWQQSVLAMLREESYYFAPQGMTKIMNEGWAVYWHSTMMTQNLLQASEVINYADSHSGTLASSPGQVNPYKLGVELFRYIEQRWNRGQFGIDYLRCDDPEDRKKWDTGAGLGREKVFEVRKIYNDVSFVDEFVDADFADEQKMYVYGLNQATGQYEIVDRDFNKVKQSLLNSLTNFGNPIIFVADANYRNRGELYLFHEWVGRDLQFEFAKTTLQYVYELWKRPVHIETREEGKPRLISFDGSEVTMKDMKASKDAMEVAGQRSE